MVVKVGVEKRERFKYISHRMKATAKSPANIAFIKYWGRRDKTLNIPENSSLSCNLNNLSTITTVEFSEKYKKDDILIDGKRDDIEVERIISHLDKIRELAKIDLKAKVVSKNSFPNSSGLASSASGFSALALAGSTAAGIKLSEKQLSMLARLGSGSASRSIPDGFVEWNKGISHETSFAKSIYPADYWDLSIIVTIITKDKKDVKNTIGHTMALASPFYPTRLQGIDEKIKKMKKAIKNKDLKTFGEILEAECLNFISIHLTSTPYIIYWEPATIKIMKLCRKLRNEGVEVYFTMDAGPQPVLYCEPRNTKKIVNRLKKEVKELKKVVLNKPHHGARIVNKHLF